MRPALAQRRIVITGLGVIAPNGQDVETFWRSVRDGLSAAGRVTQFDTGDLPHKVAAEVHDFDTDRYLDSKKARRYDKSIKYSIAAASLAVKDAGITLEHFEPDRIGIAEGTTVSGFESLFKAHDTFHRDPLQINPINVVNGYCGEGSSMIALELGIQGHAITYCSGCCSSNDAIGYAMNMIQQDEVDLMVAGGADANLLEPLWASFASLKVMTRRNDDPKGAMRPFDRRRDGFVLGEGAAFLVLEELTHALERKTKIYAEVLAHGRSCEAYHSVDLHPEGIGVYRAMEKALRRAGLHPSEIDYINAHGSATRANDPIETLAIKRFFGEHAYRLAVSSTKPVTGHLMGASGSLETIICALALERQEIPPTINLQEPDASCDLDYVPNRARAYPLGYTMNLNSGFGGKNSCLILGRYEPGDA
ncbi:MAG: beta-ketoacyl-[acyl-carrier-protein] synthase family protein [Verrucomicrobia bacterium]|nr:beta-ketoacyl-[acyl-carrier-protein] synthase family protein [Verrucomicrobiota bacterium]